MLWLAIAASAAVLFCVFLFLTLPGSYNKNRFAPFYGLNCAHRGLHTKDKAVPENSLAAFEAAKQAGYGMEFDIQLSSDGRVVVFHDDELDRVCHVKGRVDSFTYSQLQDFSLEHTSHKIPLLTDVLDLVAGETPLIIELKTGPKNAELCSRAYDILKKYNGPYCIESFDPRIVRWFKINAPEVLRGQLSAPPSVLESGFGGWLIGYGFSHFLGRPQFVAYQDTKLPFAVRFARRFAFKVVWTLTPAGDIKKMEQQNDTVIFEYYRPPARYKAE